MVDDCHIRVTRTTPVFYYIHTNNQHAVFGVAISDDVITTNTLYKHTAPPRLHRILHGLSKMLDTLMEITLLTRSTMNE